MRYTEPNLDHITPEQAKEILADICNIMWNLGDWARPDWQPDKEFNADDQNELAALLDRHNIRPYDNLYPNEEGRARIERERDHLHKRFKLMVPFATSLLVCYEGEGGVLEITHWSIFEDNNPSKPIEDLPDRIGNPAVALLERAIEAFARVVVNKLQPGGAEEAGCEGDITFDLAYNRVTVCHSDRVVTAVELPKRVF